MSVASRAFNLSIAVGLCATAIVLAQDAKPPVAGLQPDRRPVSAPVIQFFGVDAALKARRLQGVTAPWPPGVERIAEQGAWFSPMFQPGLTGRYDLRNLHGARP
jgi:hypothetical protein